MWRFRNPNPKAARVGDCVIRALSIALEKPWDETYRELCDVGFDMCDMPSSNAVWGAMLRRHGWRRYTVPNCFGDEYTVADFANDHPYGKYVLSLHGHVVSLCDGDWMDTWDSGSEIVVYFWMEG